MQEQISTVQPWTPEHGMPEVLLVTESARLRDEIARIAAAAGVGLRIVAVQDLGRVPDGSVLVLGSDGASRLPRQGADVIVAGFPEESVLLWEQAAMVAAHQVAVLPEAAAWLAEYLSRNRQRDGAGTVVAVLGATGGIGCSTLASWLAAEAAAQGVSTVLVDTDQLGGGLDLGLVPEPLSGLRWPDLAGVKGAVNPAQLRASLPVVNGFSVLSWGGGASSSSALDVPAPAIGGVMAAASEGFSLVVIDAGRVQQGLDRWLDTADQALLLMPSGTRGVLAARAAAEILHPLTVSAVVRGPLPAGLDEELAAASAGLELAAYVPRLRGMGLVQETGRLLERGQSRKVRRAVRRLAQQIMHLPGKER
ncbi:septum site-determining protein Ssd [Arthrobacter crystallopoietes]|uniref:septum site-determining protein Ssd n=1 Tax=Crystallibacter crystallopoietes TaxID=37928 RepID=UPI001ABE7D06|nr:septum site-determining protein Ssd [Arthrobacter crystallopoietes]QTG81041.1 hypothetical protein J5251_20035 [Arthrobacter crystallopoietes]